MTDKILARSNMIVCAMVDLLQIFLIVLKFAGLITASWYIVLLPVEIIGGAMITFIIVGMICACIISGRYD